MVQVVLCYSELVLQFAVLIVIYTYRFNYIGQEGLYCNEFNLWAFV